MTWREFKVAVEAAGIRDIDELHSVDCNFIHRLEFIGTCTVTKRENITDVQPYVHAYVDPGAGSRIVRIGNNECNVCGDERFGNECQFCKAEASKQECASCKERFPANMMIGDYCRDCNERLGF